ncbi:glycosyltransferase family A protein [Coleofasciculus sp. F4-SAH-05]|uniref:glycosyltransferase family A protein n=1 Tax=Coleofasciculus sp. F4-SAH-05 TaxID=3069525 RepID=UPI0032FDC064
MTTQLDIKHPTQPAIGIQPTVTLLIPVYKGGAYWQECWQSVTPLAHKFDRILVSFNYSELQQQDLQVVEADKPDNVEVIVQPQLLPTITAHLVSLIDHVDTDYIFFLCADDWLLEAGLVEALELLRNHGNQHISIVGSHEWYETTECYSIVTQHLSTFPQGMQPPDYILMDMHSRFFIQLSGLITSTSSLRTCQPMMKMFSTGWRLDDFVAAHPGINRLQQSLQPSVRIRRHPGQVSQQGALVRLSTVTDNVSYYLIQAFHSSDPLLISRAVEKVYRSWSQCQLIPHFLPAGWHILRLVLASLTWQNCPGRLKTIGYLGLYAPQVFSGVFNQIVSRIRRRLSP